MKLAGTPPYRAYGISKYLLTTEPAAITLNEEILTPGSKIELVPTKEYLPIAIGFAVCLDISRSTLWVKTWLEKPAIVANGPITTLSVQSIRCLLVMAAFIPIISLGFRRG